MAEDSDLEKTEQASSKRIEQAREKGDVPRSREMVTCFLMVVGGAVIWTLSGNLADKIDHLMVLALTFDSTLAFDWQAMFGRFADPLLELCFAILPIFGLIMLVAILAPLLLGGWLFSTESLVPKFSRINPFSGIKRMFSINSLVELIKAIAKTILIGTICYFVLKSKFDELLGLGHESLNRSIPHVGWLIWICFISLVSGMVLIASIDVPYQMWSYAKKLRMTKEQVKQEHKESEGDPHVKARIRGLQRAMARRRMMADVPTADVVVTNPTHYAVALKYSENSMKAPKIVAKGADAVALKIREIAKEKNVPILEAPPLARALHQHAEIGDEIPRALYTAVAEVLAYVFQLRMYNTHGGKAPVAPDNLDVPKELDPLNKSAQAAETRDETTTNV